MNANAKWDRILHEKHSAREGGRVRESASEKREEWKWHDKIKNTKTFEGRILLILSFLKMKWKKKTFLKPEHATYEI